ncbi:10465_t:CDS:2 [Paraglomus occultum]|uniref:Mediator of RNA polymerase II transcription subunit 20 n=1 Tax=Paraglomus occultum TaxID=144539 RepID=A0A9N8WGS7_9GLOM|nr:10465_t:CDS:2 [Paraglomus occultum]
MRELHHLLTQKLPGVYVGQWQMRCKLYLEELPNVAQKKNMYSITMSPNFNETQYCLVDNVIVEAQGDMEAILAKLRNIWSLRKTVDAETEYLATVHPYASESLLNEFISLITPSKAVIEKWKPQGDSYASVGLSETEFTDTHRAYQILMLLKKENLL